MKRYQCQCPSVNSLSPAVAAIPDLTAREREILMLVRDGESNQLIGTRLGITERTVRAHLAEVFRKLGVTSRVQAAVAAYRYCIGTCRKSQ